ncbi:MAG TPA: NADH-quinone oxidoreductase subunit L, partial [Candidatus Angelobacter sp.]|nr:NADH-quinone oxidoreductase subunit L [Candidatus Angelobacter sp.]
ILAVLSFVGGWVGIPQFMGGGNKFEHFLAPVMEPAPGAIQAQELIKAVPNAPEIIRELETNKAVPVEENAGQEWLLAGTSVAAAFIGLFFAWLLYYKRPELPDRITAKIHGIYLLVLHKYYVDEGYGAIFVKPLLALSTVVFWRGVDQGIIDGLVNGAGTTSKSIGNELRRMQSGNIRSYAAWVAIGGAAVVVFMIWMGVGR